ncbi:hypothetical protein [Paenibacillus sp. JJ1722]|uniref:hypothetical protein n=1 Tax=Paenibacillus sp. JJ1722 TaxID=3398770 RepID=UPI003AAEF301
MGFKTMFGNDSSTDFKYREAVTTYKFISDLMIVMAKYNKKVDVLKTNTGDLFGYDILLNCDNNMKHIQLKTTTKTSSWEIRNSLLKDPYGEVIIIYLQFKSEEEWNFQYRILDKQKIPDINLLPDTGKTKITQTMLEPYREIDHLAYYLFFKNE